MKRTCDGCRAVCSLDNSTCYLGFKRKYKSKKVMGILMSEYVPAEDCPKPRTYEDYMALREAQ